MGIGSLGLIVVGDYALATGMDRHVAFVASVLGKSSQTLTWAWLVPSDRVQLASALHEAWQRPHAVACLGGLGTGVDDVVHATVSALQTGREQIGLARHAEHQVDGVFVCANVAFFSGHPVRAHQAIERWWLSCETAGDSGSQVNALARERIRWALPESVEALDARRKIKLAFPAVAQHLTSAGNGEVMLTFTASSKGKAQGARKALQRAMNI